MILLVGNRLLRRIEDIESRLRDLEKTLAERDDIQREDVGLTTPLEEVESSVETLQTDHASLARETKSIGCQLDTVWNVLEQAQKQIEFLFETLERAGGLLIERPDDLRCPDFSVREPAAILPEQRLRIELPEGSPVA